MFAYRQHDEQNYQRENFISFVLARDVEAVYLQTASAPIASSASASKKIHPNFASKIRPVC